MFEGSDCVRKIIACNLFVFAVTAVSIIFMLELYIKEQPVLHSKEIAQKSTYTLHVEEQSQSNSQLPVFNSTPYGLKEENSAQNNETNDNEIKIDDTKEKNNEESDLRDFNEESLDKLIQQRERNFNKTTDKAEKKEDEENLNINKIVVTPEKILKVQKEIDFGTKSKAIGILMKLGPAGIGQIMKMSQDGVTTEEGHEMMDILKERLSENDINFLKSIVNKYFEGDTNTK